MEILDNKEIDNPNYLKRINYQEICRLNVGNIRYKVGC